MLGSLAGAVLTGKSARGVPQHHVLKFLLRFHTDCNNNVFLLPGGCVLRWPKQFLGTFGVFFGFAVFFVFKSQVSILSMASAAWAWTCSCLQSPPVSCLAGGHTRRSVTARSWMEVAVFATSTGASRMAVYDKL